MIIFNVTTIIEESIHHEFHQFMHKVYLPKVLASNKFDDAKLFKLTEPTNEGITYCAQYFARTQEDLNEFRAHDFNTLQQNLMQKFPNKLVFFSSVLELSNPL